MGEGERKIEQKREKDISENIDREREREREGRGGQSREK